MYLLIFYGIGKAHDEESDVMIIITVFKDSYYLKY